MRIHTYIDGYNLYHAINDLSVTRDADGQYIQRADKQFLKWLDVQKLSDIYCGGLRSEKITYFSASPKHLSESKIKRHKTYTDALVHKGVEYVEGQFKRTGDKWIKTGDTFIHKQCFEEKESDVNLAICLVRDALLKKMDKALIITNDSDIAPAIRMAKLHNPGLILRVVTPPLQSGAVVNHDLLQAAGQVKRNGAGQVFRETKIISEDMLLKCQLADKMITAEGVIIARPQKYAVPKELR